MTAIRLEGVKRVCLADQARGCEDDARDECSEAAIQQDFVKDWAMTASTLVHLDQKVTAKC